jgi:hypothetical protein
MDWLKWGQNDGFQIESSLQAFPSLPDLHQMTLPTNDRHHRLLHAVIHSVSVNLPVVVSRSEMGPLHSS